MTVQPLATNERQRVPVGSMLADGKRLIEITPGNIRNSHIYITGHHDLFPDDCFGGHGRGSDGLGEPVSILLDGLGRTVRTDIGRDRKTGKPRRMFRGRAWVKDFFKLRAVKPGDTLALERVAERTYMLSVARRARDSTSPSFAEFFAGIGLVRMGLEAAGWQVAFANDIDPKKREMYAEHYQDSDGHYDPTDVHLLDPEVVPTVLLATASFPCTDLSLAGQWRGIKGKQSSAFYGFRDLIAHMGVRRPPLVLVENVLGFLTSHSGEDFRDAMHALNDLGYAVDPFVLDARCFVPQSRPRLFVVASLVNQRDAPRFALASRVRPPGLLSYIGDHEDIDWSIRDLPDPPLRAQKTLQDIVEDLEDSGPEWWSKERADYLYGQMSDRHRELADSLIAKRRWSYATVFRRVRRQADGDKRSMAEVRYDGIAGCLRTPRGGSGRQILFKAGFGRYAARLITPRECARLMGADDYRINAPLNQALFGFGDAVCVPAITWIAEHYLNPLVNAARSVMSSSEV